MVGTNTSRLPTAIPHFVVLGRPTTPPSLISGNRGRRASGTAPRPTSLRSGTQAEIWGPTTVHTPSKYGHLTRGAQMRGRRFRRQPHTKHQNKVAPPTPHHRIPGPSLTVGSSAGMPYKYLSPFRFVASASPLCVGLTIAYRADGVMGRGLWLRRGRRRSPSKRPAGRWAHALGESKPNKTSG